MEQWVIGVIPTYRPPEDLVTRVLSLQEHTDNVIVSDDASPCTSDDVLRSLEGLSGVSVIRHDRNAGIARGLNDGLAAARSAGATWLLTVDQDTELGPDYLRLLGSDALRRQVSGSKVGAIGAERIVDPSGVLSYPTRNSARGPETEELIQTGTLWSVSALTEIGGFDEALGIDAVDAAACLRLRQRGYSVCVSPGSFVSHAIGSARMVRLFGRNIMITGHSPERRATMVRNRLRLFPAEFAQSPRHALRTVRRVSVNQALGFLVESNRWAKAKGSIRGLTSDKTR